MIRMIYSLFLLQTAWHDLRKRQIPIWIFLLFGAVGVGVVFLSLSGFPGGIRVGTGIGSIAGFLPGIALLSITACTRGQIGSGDGFFFLVSALYLSVRNLLLLLSSGLIFCSAFCLGMVIWGAWSGVNVRKMRLPFLPFLIPAWLWLLFFCQTAG